MGCFLPPSDRRHLVWICGDSLEAKLDAATWVETSQELARMGWRVTLVAVGAHGTRTVRGVEILTVPRPRLYLVRQAVFHIRVLLRLHKLRDDVDIIMFHQMSAPWVLPLRLVRTMTRSRAPLLVMDTRTLSMVPAEHAGPRARLRRSFYVITERMANRWGDGRVAITERMADAIGIPSEKLWGVWPSGVNLNVMSRAREQRRWPAEGEPVQLVYVGVLHVERNLLTLAEAVERANSEGMEFALTLVGDGTERDALELFARGTEGRIKIRASIPRGRVVDVLSAAHVGVLPFPDEEKFRVSSPIKLFEYMGAGLPVLATRIVCHTDVIGSADFAFWARSSDVTGLLDALRGVWSSRSSLRFLGEKAAVSAESWTWQRSADRLRSALEYGLLTCQVTARTSVSTSDDRHPRTSP